MCGGTADPSPGESVSPRSIPACAGEPPLSITREGSMEVYPGVCGGTTGTTATDVRDVGLSPRVRGNLRRILNPNGRRGSIPACAGEPRA